MKKNKKTIAVAVAAIFLCLVDIWAMYGLIHKGTGMRFGLAELFGKAVPVLMTLLLIACAAAALGLAIRRVHQEKVGAPLWLTLLFPVALFYLEGYVALRMSGMLYPYQLFCEVTGALALALILVYLYPRFMEKRGRAVRAVACVLLVCLAVCGIFQLRINSIRYDAVVYAVEDTYQIVWYTDAKSTAWVEIDGQKYHDAGAGNIKSTQKIHKVTVPMQALDEAKSYSIHSQSVLLHAGYLAIKGRLLQRDYTFRPVELSDGVQFYNIGDSHDFQEGAAKGAAYWGDRLDFFLMNGDITSESEFEPNLLNILKLGGRVAKGSIPVLYARGNHENRGALAAQVHDYIGSTADGKFYYPVRFGSLWILLLDCGEDKRDDHSEYSGLAAFDAYRAGEDAFIEELLAHPEENWQAPGVEYRLLISHSPLNICDDADGALYEKWVRQMNGIGFDLAISGHTGGCEIFEPYGTRGDRPLQSAYWSMLGSDSTDLNGIPKGETNGTRRYFTGSAVELQPDAVTIRFVNQDLEVCREQVIPRA